ncbi:MAG: carbohydrate ABC transporter permease [Eubacterium sp.]|nr:carbohydrate ABC transporter permease [Eubacterium sp.]
MGMKAKRTILTVIATVFFAVLSFIIVFPLIAGLIASFRPGTELIRRGLSVDLDFSTMTLANYKYLFGNNVDGHKYFMWYKNSLILTAISVVGTLFICYIVAYGLTMYNYKIKNFLFFLVIATMMVPFEILILPLYKEMISLNLIDTIAGVVLPGICGASTIFFFRQYMTGLPKELLDAGRIDGATEYGICFKIMLPITKPAFAAMSILSAMGAWNNVLWPMLVFRSAEKFTLPIGLNTLLTPYGNNYDVLIAGSMFGIIPVFIVFLCFQRYFIEGMTAGAVKG